MEKDGTKYLNSLVPRFSFKDRIKHDVTLFKTSEGFDRLRHFQTMPVEKQKYYLYIKGISIPNASSVTASIYDNGNKFKFIISNFGVAFNKDRSYLKSHGARGLFYDFKTKKLGVWNTSLNAMLSTIVNTEGLAETLGLEWLRQFFHDMSVVFAEIKPIDMKAIFEGRITNGRQLTERVLTRHFGKGAIPTKLFLKAMKAMGKSSPYRRYLMFKILKQERRPQKILKYFIKDPEGANKHILHNHTLEDLREQALVLNLKIDSTWTARRIEETHREWTNRIMSLVSEDLSKEKVKFENFEAYIAEHEPPFKIKIINNEYDAYVEGVMQHNCIYTNYWKKIRNKTYFVAQVITDDTVIDVGINYDGTVEQVYAAYNADPDKEIKKKIKKWFSKPKVHDALIDDLYKSVTDPPFTAVFDPADPAFEIVEQDNE